MALINYEDAIASYIQDDDKLVNILSLNFLVIEFLMNINAFLIS
jgi:hypothetical protein